MKLRGQTYHDHAVDVHSRDDSQSQGPESPSWRHLNKFVTSPTSIGSRWGALFPNRCHRCQWFAGRFPRDSASSQALHLVVHELSMRWDLANSVTSLFDTHCTLNQMRGRRTCLEGCRNSCVSVEQLVCGRMFSVPPVFAADPGASETQSSDTNSETTRAVHEPYIPNLKPIISRTTVLEGIREQCKLVAGVEIAGLDAGLRFSAILV